ncbi:MAG: N-acetylmuramoyl-L-alanine amidase [Methylobacter sp.]|jgi:N-acetylmuramoyl-L-alanine amidase
MFVFGLQLWSVAGFAQQINVNSIRYETTPDQTQMMIDVTSSSEHRVFLMGHPARLVIDIRNASLKQPLSQPPASHPLFFKVRSAARNETDLRIVFDLKRAVSSKNVSLSSNDVDGHQLVIGLLDKGSVKNAPAENKVAAKLIESKPVASNEMVSKVTASEQVVEKTVEESKKVASKERKKRKDSKASADSPAEPIKVAQRGKGIVIAIDAGHGGNDPGAHGTHGTEEKGVTFAIAKKLAALINSQPGMKAVMVRKGDYYVDLRKRMKIARAAKADLFISIHADAFQNSTVKGASVFTLSSKGATSEAARWLANSENASDLVGGVSLDDKDDVLASVLLDLSQTATQEASVKVAGKVLKNFESIGELHHGSVQKAGFLVLKSPDVPSILVETAFISNPSDELKLVNTAHQTKIALAIFNGVRSYFSSATPIGNVAALDM